MTSVPDCDNCERPLGLYYAECPRCLLFANTYTLADYRAGEGR